MRDVKFENCNFEDYIWQNDRREGLSERLLISNKCYNGTVIGKEIPEEIRDPQWLVNELDGTNELIRAIEAGRIGDLQSKEVLPKPALANEADGDETYATKKLREWDELANGSKQWWQ